MDKGRETSLLLESPESHEYVLGIEAGMKQLGELSDKLGKLDVGVSISSLCWGAVVEPRKRENFGRLTVEELVDQMLLFRKDLESQKLALQSIAEEIVPIYLSIRECKQKLDEWIAKETKDQFQVRMVYPDKITHDPRKNLQTPNTTIEYLVSIIPNEMKKANM